jgi:Immunity protein 51
MLRSCTREIARDLARHAARHYICEPAGLCFRSAQHMKKVEDLVFPKNLAVIMDQDGIWGDDSFEPIKVIVIEAEIEEEDIMCYQMEIVAGAAFEEIEAVMEANGVDADGYGWEDMIREYIHHIDPILENKLESDSETATCVLWVPDEASFRKLLGHTLDLTDNLNAVKRVFE